MRTDNMILIEDLQQAMIASVGMLSSVPLEEALLEAKRLIHQSIREGFNSSADPQTNDGWQARKHPYPHPILMKTGAMMQAATGGGAGAIERIENNQLEVGVSGATVGYAAFHQHGTSRMVARPFIGASDAKLDEIGEVIADAGLVAFGGA